MNNNYYLGKPPMIQEHQMLEIMAPLVPLIRDREAIYLDLLSFVNANIDSSSNDYDQIAIFRKFLLTTAQSEGQILDREAELTRQVSQPSGQEEGQGYLVASTSKEMMRLSGRLIEIVEASVERVRKSLFSEGGKLSIEFARFKKALHKIIKESYIDLADFSTLFITFSRSKYRKQVSKIKSYLKRLEVGDCISLKDLFSRDGSDQSLSPEEKSKSKSKPKTFKRSPEIQQSETESPQRKSSKRTSLAKSTKNKRTLNLKPIKRQEESPVEKKPSKTATATKLLKFYNIMEITKKEFLEDYIFEAQEEEEQRRKLMNCLIERNKFNGEQIRDYQKRCEKFNPSLHLLPQSSGEDSPSSCRRNMSATSKMSLKTSFVISRRKPSFTFDSPSERSDAEVFKGEIPLSRTIKNLSSTKRPEVMKSSTSRPKPPPQRASKKFVAKSPLIFEDEIIPKAETATRAWVQTPLTGRERNRRNENIRLKRQNNPCPLDGSVLGNSFHFTQYPV